LPVEIIDVKSAGYSGTPLAQKLGIGPSTAVCVINQPSHYRKLLGKTVRASQIVDRVEKDAAFIHLFTTDRAELHEELKRLRHKISDSGMIWISWPKKSAGVPTNITEDTIRDAALPLGLVDVKVCAVDEIWSGLKLMIRREKRRCN
jgi:hypothetical protein